jgi:hypothetical protein
MKFRRSDPVKERDFNNVEPKTTMPTANFRVTAWSSERSLSKKERLGLQNGSKLALRIFVPKTGFID